MKLPLKALAVLLLAQIMLARLLLMLWLPATPAALQPAVKAQAPFDSLLAAGFDASLPSLFTWEGVSYYLSDGVIDATMRSIRRCKSAAVAPPPRRLAAENQAGTPRYYSRRRSHFVRELWERSPRRHRHLQVPAGDAVPKGLELAAQPVVHPLDGENCQGGFP